MIYLELTRTDAVLSRTIVVFFFVQKSKFSKCNETFWRFFGTKEALEASLEGQKSHEVGTTHQGEPAPSGAP